MFRISILGATVVTLAFLAGCESVDVKRNEAREAQREANQEIAEAQREANREIAEAQREANEEAREAEDAFIRARNDLRSRLQEELDELSADINDIDVRATSAQYQAKAELEAKSRRLQDYRDTLKRDLDSLERTTSADWEATKARIEQNIDSFKRSVRDSSPKI